MTLALTAIHQIVIMFLIILVGMISFKMRLIDSETNKKLADVVLLLVNPIVIFVSYQREFEAALLRGLLISLALALFTHLFSILVSLLFLRKKKREAVIAIERFAIVYSNCGFIGIPLVNGILGSEGVFYITAYMTIFNLVLWSHGMVTMSGKGDRKTIMKAVLSPSILATVSGFILFLVKVNLPDIVNEALVYIGDMNTPLAMMVAGITIAQTDLRKLICKLRIYYITLLKLIFVPIAVLLIFSLMDLPRVVVLTSVLAAACPTAASISLFALRYDKDYRYASELFAVSTILSLLSIPLVMYLANRIIP